MAKEESLGNQYDIQRAENAWKNAGDINEYLDQTHDTYTKGISGLEELSENVTDYYAPLTANLIDPEKIMTAQVDLFGGEKGVDATIRDRMGRVNLMGTDNLGYTAGQTNVAGLARGADTGLSNVFNNLQVSTAGAQMQAAQTDQALANTLGLASQAGTGAGGATALAAAAAQSKAGIAASIDQQVKQNELLRAQGEQGLQRDLLAQGNLASQFGLGQQQFNVGQANQAAQFEASARNQANQFNAQSQNQWQLQGAQMANAMDQFNISNQNAAFSNYAANVNAALGQNASMQNKFDMDKAAGQTQHQSNQWDTMMNLQDIYTSDYVQALTDARENQGLIEHGQALAEATGAESMFTNSAVNKSGGMKGNGEIISPDFEWLSMRGAEGSNLYSVGAYADAADDANNSFTNRDPNAAIDFSNMNFELDFDGLAESIAENWGTFEGYQPPPTNDDD